MNKFTLFGSWLGIAATVVVLVALYIWYRRRSRYNEIFIEFTLFKTQMLGKCASFSGAVIAYNATYTFNYTKTVPVRLGYIATNWRLDLSSQLRDQILHELRAIPYFFPPYTDDMILAAKRTPTDEFITLCDIAKVENQASFINQWYLLTDNIFQNEILLHGGLFSVIYLHATDLLIAEIEECIHHRNILRLDHIDKELTSWVQSSRKDRTDKKIRSMLLKKSNEYIENNKKRIGGIILGNMHVISKQKNSDAVETLKKMLETNLLQSHLFSEECKEVVGTLDSLLVTQFHNKHDIEEKMAILKEIHDESLRQKLKNLVVNKV